METDSQEDIAWAHPANRAINIGRTCGGLRPSTENQTQEDSYHSADKRHGDARRVWPSLAVTSFRRNNKVVNPSMP